MMNLWVFWYLSVVCVLGTRALGNVVLVGKNETLSFEDIEANFAPSVKGSGKCGTLYAAEPLDACSTLTNKVEPVKNSTHDLFLLIIRGGCSFEDKVRQAQAAGFQAAIIYNDEYGDLVAMAGNSAGVQIPAVFISRVSGERLTKYAGDVDVEVWIIPSFENSAWSIMAISFISLLAMSAVLATCFFVRRHRIRSRSVNVNIRDKDGMTPLDILRQRPHSASSELLTKQLISAGGIFSQHDYSARRVVASHLKMQHVGSSPGTSFRLSDTEIFLYTGIEHDGNESAQLSTSTELSQHNVSTENACPRNEGKTNSANNAAQRLKRFFHWPKIRKGDTQRLKKLADQSCARNSEAAPVPLRQRFSKPSSLPNNKRTLSVRSNLPSPTAKKKLASGLVNGVMLAIPHLSVRRRSSCSSSFSVSSVSSHTSLDQQKATQIENELAKPSSNHVRAKSSDSIYKQITGNKSLVNQYLCFGASEETVKATSSELRPYELYERSVLSTA